MIRSTWDGQPVSPEPPYGATIVVFRMAAGGPEFLMLHRAHHGPAYEGDWAWTAPAGARLPGEPIDDCARRELLEETGLARELTPTKCGTSAWPVYTVQVGLDTVVMLDDEHDRFEWVPSSAAVARCRPDRALLPLQAAVRLIHRLG